MEQASATAEVFDGKVENVNEHFKSVGRALGLVRIKDLHMGKINDLMMEVKEQDNANDNNASDVRPRPGE